MTTTPIITPTPPRQTHPDTSTAAYVSVDRTNARAIHRWILMALSYHPDGMTHEQLADFHAEHPDAPPTSQSGLRTRVSELVHGDVVYDSGWRRPMRTGRNAIVWMLVPENYEQGTLL